MPLVIGHIDALFRYPVKSMAGERLEAATLGWHGIEGAPPFAHGVSLFKPTCERSLMSGDNAAISVSTALTCDASTVLIRRSSL